MAQNLPYQILIVNTFRQTLPISSHYIVKLYCLPKNMKFFKEIVSKWFSCKYMISLYYTIIYVKETIHKRQEGDELQRYLLEVKTRPSFWPCKQYSLQIPNVDQNQNGKRWKQTFEKLRAGRHQWVKLGSLYSNRTRRGGDESPASESVLWANEKSKAKYTFFSFVTEGDAASTISFVNFFTHWPAKNWIVTKGIADFGWDAFCSWGLQIYFLPNAI